MRGGVRRSGPTSFNNSFFVGVICVTADATIQDGPTLVRGGVPVEAVGAVHAVP